MRRSAALALIFSLCAGIAPAQDTATLADIRQDIAVLNVELAKLQRELSTTGGASVVIGGDQLDRINAIEAALARVTSKTEQLEFRIGQVVSDGTNRLGDLEFRVCEVEPGCDLGAIGQTKPLGGEQAAAAPAPVRAPAAAPLPTGGAQLAVNEETDFRRAQEALASGDFRGAQDLFATYRQTYPLGPLEPAALVGEGQSLEGQGDTREAARRYLDAYSNYPNSEVAAEALWRLGTSLAALGSIPEACVTLAEVGNRYADSAYVGQAQDSRAQLTCP